METLQITETSQNFFDMTNDDIITAYIHAIYTDEVELFKVKERGVEKAQGIANYWDKRIDMLNEMILVACGVKHDTTDREKHAIQRYIWEVGINVRGYARVKNKNDRTGAGFHKVSIDVLVRRFHEHLFVDTTETVSATV